MSTNNRSSNRARKAQIASENAVALESKENAAKARKVAAATRKATPKNVLSTAIVKATTSKPVRTESVCEVINSSKLNAFAMSGAFKALLCPENFTPWHEFPIMTGGVRWYHMISHSFVNFRTVTDKNGNTRQKFDVVYAAAAVSEYGEVLVTLKEGANKDDLINEYSRPDRIAAFAAATMDDEGFFAAMEKGRETRDKVAKYFRGR